MVERFHAYPIEIGKLLLNSKFKVPKYQRSYSWRREANIFLEDILKAIKEDKSYFIGPMIFLRTPKIRDRYIIIDGQQRLITTAILLAIIRDVLKMMGIEESSNDIHRDYLIEKRAYIQEGDLRIFPNRIDKQFFEEIVKFKENPDEKIKRLEKLLRSQKIDSWKKMLTCYQSFYEKLRKIKDVHQFLRIVEYLEKKIETVIMETGSDEDAYLIFETLNARGLRLSQVDLIKNFLFNKIGNEREIEYYESKWNSILREITSRDTLRLLRYYWISKYDFIREKELFSAFKHKITTKKHAKKTIDELEIFKDHFVNVRNPSRSVFQSEEIVNMLEDLKLIGITQHIPILFSLLENYPNIRKVKRRIWVLYVTLLRRIICKRNPNEFEKKLGELCRSLNKKDIKKYEEILKELSPKREEFKTSLTSYLFKTAKDRHLAKALLRIIENTKCKEIKVNRELTLEHIFPESRKNELKEQECVYKIGNFTFLLQSENIKAGAKNFKKKKEIFKYSLLKINKKLKNVGKWDEQEINKRTDEIVRNLERILKF